MSKWYHISNTEKYGINERQYFINRDKDVMMVIDTNWKWGDFTVNADTPPTSEEVIELYENFNESHVDSVESGVEEFEFRTYSTGEIIEMDNQLINDYHEEGLNALFDAGFGEEEDPEIYIEGGFNVEEGENPYIVEIDLD